MFPSSRLTVLAAVFALLLGAAPADATECVEVGQMKHCLS